MKERFSLLDPVEKVARAVLRVSSNLGPLAQTLLLNHTRFKYQMRKFDTFDGTRKAKDKIATSLRP